MGVENNECVIATTWNDAAVTAIKIWLKTRTCQEQSLFVFVPSIVNDKTTILLAPCGSKKGWKEDELAGELRDAFIQLLDTFNYDDGSSPFDWLEVGYGEFGQKVLRGNCTNRYSDKEYESEE